MWNTARKQGSPVRQFGEEYSNDAVCPVFYSSPPTSHPQQPRGGSGPQAPRGAMGSGPQNRGGSGALDAVSDRASLADDFSLPSSPAHSICSDTNAGSTNASPLHDDFRQRRMSLDQASEAYRGAPSALPRGKGKGFLSKDQMQLTPVRWASPLFESGPSRPAASQGGSPLFPGSPSNGTNFNRHGSPAGTPLFMASPSASSTGGGAGSDCGSPLFPSYASNPSGPRGEEYRSGSALFAPHMQNTVRGGSASASPMHHRNTTGLREQVLIRSSSGHSTEFARVGDARGNEDDIPESVEAECLNLSETEAICQEKELEKEILDGLQIVPLPNHLGFGAGSAQHVLYALFFSSQDQKPTLPGDDSIKLLFPKQLQAAAGGQSQNGQAKKQGSRSPFFECKPYQAPKESKPARNRGTPIAMFGQYKPAL